MTLVCVKLTKKEPNTHKHLETDARSVSWREDDSLLLLLLLLLLSSFCGHVLCVAASEERAGPLPRHRGCSKGLRPSMVLSFLCFKGTSNSLTTQALESACWHQIAAEKVAVLLPGPLSPLPPKDLMSLRFGKRGLMTYVKGGLTG